MKSSAVKFKSDCCRLSEKIKAKDKGVFIPGQEPSRRRVSASSLRHHHPPVLTSGKFVNSRSLKTTHPLYG